MSKIFFIAVLLNPIFTSAFSDNLPKGSWQKSCKEISYEKETYQLRARCQTDENPNHYRYSQIKALPGDELNNRDGELVLIPNDRHPKGKWRESCVVIAYEQETYQLEVYCKADVKTNRSKYSTIKALPGDELNNQQEGVRLPLPLLY